MKKLLRIVAIATVFALCSADIISDSLTVHNNERNAHGVASLTWSASLAATAQSYAETMAKTGTTSHSTGRVNVGENLAWGSGKSVNVLYLAGLWVNEKEYFIAGKNFPDVSTTGSWQDVAHYSQLMWQKTTQVGCGIAQASSGRYYYVCHYSPQGNINGQPVYTSSSSSSTSTGSTTGSTGSTTTTTPSTGSSTSSSQPSSSSSSSSSASTSAPDASSSSFITDSLNAHNTERNAHGVASLTWSASLAATAQSYAETMAKSGTTSHSTGRNNVGENLAWGSGKSITTTSLIGLWLAEKKYFIAGKDFPNVSTTGSWSTVAHYSQMMWQKTTQVGCGVAKASSGRYNLVCHYYVQGNINGQPVYTVTSGSTQPTNTTNTTTTTPPANTTSTTNTTAPANTTSSTNTTTTSPANSTSTTNTTTTTPAQSQFITDVLTAHNTERNSHGVASLVWNTSLAATAQAYAQTMAKSGTTSHSTGRTNVGENLAWGSGKSITTTSLIGLWLAEKKYFISGKNFPDVSTTGSWSTVAHYSQMMWQKTTQVGCGIAQASSGRYNLVCHYYVQGNINGQPVYTSSSSSSSSTGSTSTGSTGSTGTTNTTTSTGSSSSSGQPSSSSSSSSSTSSTQTQFITDSLNAHNTERNAHGVPSLTWSTDLAATAQAYAQTMASTGTTSHSTNRVNVGENLAWGSGSSITVTHLAGLWLAEKQYYIAGQDFPNVSTTGSWSAVAHYTQLMWRKTTQVGCGMAQASSGRYNYVCHYSPQGNINGQPVY